MKRLGWLLIFVGFLFPTAMIYSAINSMQYIPVKEAATNIYFGLLSFWGPYYLLIPLGIILIVTQNFKSKLKSSNSKST